MSLYLRQITVENFRRFRSPIVLDNLGKGLNVLIAPNEAGKSTLLEAVRAAFFVRTKGQSKQLKSYVPYGDKVGPSVTVDFALNGQDWRVEKRFVQSPKTTLIGPEGRSEGEDAEHNLRVHLGAAVGGSGKKAEPEGALGMLWVRQAEALELTAPDDILRDRLRVTLEQEVGSILGGSAFNRVKDQVEQLSLRYGTARSRTQGLLPEVQARCEAAQVAYEQAKALHDALEEKFGRLEQVRTRLKLVGRELNNEDDARQHEQLHRELKAAEGAVQRLQLRRAELEGARRIVADLDALQKRSEDLAQEKAETQELLAALSIERGAANEHVQDLQQKVVALEQKLLMQRQELQGKREAVREVERIHAAHMRAEAWKAASTRYTQLLACEEALQIAERCAGDMIADDVMKRLDAAERDVVEKRALMSVDAARVTLSGDVSGALVNGNAVVEGGFTLDEPMSLQIGDTFVLLEPSRSAQRARQDYEVAQRLLAQHLQELGVSDILAARHKNEKARRAVSDVKSLKERIASLCSSDVRLGLNAGADALKILMASENQEVQEGDVGQELPDLSSVQNAAEIADDNFIKSQKMLELLRAQLREAEDALLPFTLKTTVLSGDVERNTRDWEQLTKHVDWEGLADKRVAARARLSDATLSVQETEDLVQASNPELIKRRIERLDMNRKSAEETRARLREELSSLEAAIEAEGGRGLSERLIAAEDEQGAAHDAQLSIKDEVDTLQLLRGVLDEARSEMAGRFVAPVARRAKSYVEKILPGSAPGFDEALKLSSLVRGQYEEGSEDLSKGTQEQLSLIVRLAFADILQQQGQPVSLILDDPLVYADDARLDLMLAMLEQASERLQIVILTCRERAFRMTTGQRLTLPSA